MSRPDAQREAETAARKLLKKFEIDEPPVDVDRLADALGAVVRRRPNSPDIAGLLYTEGDDVIIGVNADDSHVRQRFTVAHELGHLQLHKTGGFFVDRTYRAATKHSRVPGDAGQERQANWFAAELLMPQSMVQRVAAELLEQRLMTDDALIGALAEKFRVSRQAMGFRLRSVPPWSSNPGFWADMTASRCSTSLSRAVARERRDAPRWIVDTNGDPVKLWNGAGRLVTDPALVWVELGLWEALQDGLVTVEFDDEGNSWWGPVNGEQET